MFLGSFFQSLALAALLALPGAAANNPAPGTFKGLAHSPEQPKSAEPVRVTAEVSGTGGLESVTLQVQSVAPGRFIRKTDPDYEKGWRDFPMHDDGRDGDARSGDGVFTVQVPGELQQHRHLLRYRAIAKTKTGTSARWPEATNASPNLAWFAYDGLPAWRGASKPGKTPALDFSPEFLATLPAYHLIARAEDVRQSQWDGAAYRKPFPGAFVYRGRVYDHIQFHNRGQASTYVAGKNKWGFRFNPGQDLEVRDLWGRSYQSGWTGFNLNPCASAWAPVNRGMAGMDEAISYRAYQLAGVPSPDTFWVQLRVIDSPAETSANNQYEGDLWGLYLVVQEKNGKWLKQNHLPDGNIFSIDSGPKHIAKGMPTNGVDFTQFRSHSSRSQSGVWWSEHLDLTNYYSFHALNRVVANIDLRQDGNHYLYHRPDERWVILPHDLDMMFIPKTHWPGIVEQARCLEVPTLRLEYQNRAREILDLFCADASPAGGQIGQLVAEYARVLAPTGQERNWAELDEAMWNWHPRSNAQGQFNVTPYRDQRMGGGWRRNLATPDFAGFCQYIVQFCTDSRPVKNYRPNDGNQLGYGYGFLWSESRDETIPARPEIKYTGAKNFPVDQLTFTSGAFASPASGTWAATQWRVARISAPGLVGYVAGQPCRYELESSWTSGTAAAQTSELRVPKEVCAPGQTYRARVRHRDQTGRWSRWSEPVQFVTAAARP